MVTSLPSALAPLCRCARLELASDEDRPFLTGLQLDLDFRLRRLGASFQKNDLGHRAGGEREFNRRVPTVPSAELATTNGTGVQAI